MAHRIEVRIRMTVGGMITRHYVYAGAERALCGVLTLRPATYRERAQGAHMCQRCVSHLDALHRKGGRS